MKKMLVGCAGAFLMTTMAACLAPVDEASEIAEIESAVVINPVDQLNTDGLAFIARGFGQTNGNICFTDAAGAERCVATGSTSPVRYVGGDTVYTSAPPIECQVGVTGGLSSCQSFTAAPGDPATALWGCIGAHCLCVGYNSCYAMKSGPGCGKNDIVCSPEGTYCYCGPAA